MISPIKHCILLRLVLRRMQQRPFVLQDLSNAIEDPQRDSDHPVGEDRRSLD
jgi:hypothetical protein